MNLWIFSVSSLYTIGIVIHPVDYKGNKLKLSNADLSAVAKKSGTPVFVYSSKRILERLETLRGAFESELHVHYAMKANSHPQILKLLKKAGTGVDVVSQGEIKWALKCGFKPQDVIFSGVAKTHDEITYALRQKIKLFNVESPQELDRIGQLAKKSKVKAQVGIRINPDVDPKTHPYITTGFRENKFGMDESFLPEIHAILAKYKNNLVLKGLSFHIGSQLTEIKPFEDALEKSIPVYRAMQAQGHPLNYFNIGGGIGISYDGSSVLDVQEYGEKMEKLLKPLGCEIWCEPGRYIVADAGVLIGRVEYIKNTPFKTFVIVNTGMHHLLRPALYEAYHRVLPVIRQEGPAVPVDIVGPICESSDWLAKDRLMVLPQPGDLLAFLDAGAYGSTMSSDYNLHPRAKEVVL